MKSSATAAAAACVQFPSKPTCMKYDQRDQRSCASTVSSTSSSSTLTSSSSSSKKTTKKKRVTFYEGVRVKEIPSLIDYCTSYEELEDFIYENFYTKQEYQRMQNSDKALLCLIQREQEATSSVDDDDDESSNMIHILTHEDDANILNVCLRGLECRTKIGMKRKMMNRLAAYDAVFYEQDMQYEDLSRTSFDLIAIANVYTLYTQCAKLSAINLAKQDEEYVNEYIRPTCEYYHNNQDDDDEDDEVTEEQHQDEGNGQVQQETKTPTVAVSDLCKDTPQVARQRLSIQHVVFMTPPPKQQHHQQQQQHDDARKTYPSRHFRRRSFIGAAA